MLLTKPTNGHSINAATGSMQFAATDFHAPGKVDLTWLRTFSSLSRNLFSPLGCGWHSPFFSKLTWDEIEEEYLFHASNGSVVSFPAKAKQETRLINEGAFSELSFSDTHIIVCQWDVDTHKATYYWFRHTDKYAFSSLEKITDATQQGVELAYDKQDRLKYIRQIQEKRTFALHHNDQNLICQIDFIDNDDTLIPKVFYHYDNQKRLIKESNSSGSERSFQYNNLNLITAITYKNGSTYDFLYDDNHACIYAGTKQGFGSKHFTYFPIVGRSEAEDSKGNKTWYQCNENGQIAEETNATGIVAKTNFDEYGRVIETVDAQQNVTRYAYDDNGNRSAMMDALGNKTFIEYNVYHQITKYTDAQGATWHRSYDGQQRLVTITTPLQKSYNFTYDRFGNLTEINDPNGAKIRQQFDARGILQANTDWEGHISRYQFDPQGNLTCHIDPLGYPTHYRYTSTGLLDHITYPDKTTETFLYDKADNVVVHENRNGEKTEYRYGLCNRLMEKIDAIGRQISFGWGTELEQLEDIINAKGEQYTFEYNATGQITKETGFDGRVLQYEYDPVGNRVATINGLDERIEYQHDALGNLVGQHLPDDSVTTFAYDKRGLLVDACNADSHITFQRDKLGRVLEEIQNGHIIRRSYEANGNLKQLQLDESLSLQYQFDANSLLSQFSLNGHQPTHIQRDARGSETARTMGNGLQLQQSFDVMGRVTEQLVVNDPQHNTNHSSSNPAAKRQYQYRQALLGGIQDIHQGKTQYDYDPVERLTKVVRSHGVSEDFLYDDNDNIVQAEQDGNLSERLYDQGDHLIQQDEYHLQYDAQGRLIQKSIQDESGVKKIWTYQWDVLDQLTTFTTPEGEAWHYAYDPFGRRISKTNPDKQKHKFIWDADVVLQELHDDGKTVNWVFDPHSFAPLGKEENRQFYSIVNDHLGTPQEMFDRFGRNVWQVTYTAWGEISQQRDQDVDCPVRFQGQWADEESGLYYNRFRYYDSGSAKFISDDPVKLQGGLNLSSYTNNPISIIDPLGLCDGTTPHTIVTGGKHPKKSEPNSIIESRRADGSSSVTYYDGKGRMFSREDYGQQRTHGELGRGSDGRSVPHEHRVDYSDRGPVGKRYRQLDNNGKPVGPWIDD